MQQQQQRDEEADAIVAQAGSIGPEREAEIRKLVLKVRERARNTTGAGVAQFERAAASLSDARGAAPSAPVASQSTTAAARASDLASGSEAGKPPQPFSPRRRTPFDWKRIEIVDPPAIADALLELHARLDELSLKDAIRAEQYRVLKAGLDAIDAKLEQAGVGTEVGNPPTPKGALGSIPRPEPTSASLATARRLVSEHWGAGNYAELIAAEIDKARSPVLDLAKVERRFRELWNETAVGSMKSALLTLYAVEIAKSALLSSGVRDVSAAEVDVERVVADAHHAFVTEASFPHIAQAIRAALHAQNVRTVTP